MNKLSIIHLYKIILAFNLSNQVLWTRLDIFKKSHMKTVENDDSKMFSQIVFYPQNNSKTTLFLPYLHQKMVGYVISYILVLWSCDPSSLLSISTTSQ